MKFKDLIPFLLGITASLLSSMKLLYLPEIELFLLFFILLTGNSEFIISYILIILCSHHYAIPDESFRFDASNYPSIYTKKLGYFKVFDVLTLILFPIALFKYLRNKPTFTLNRNYPNILFFLSIILIFITPIRMQDINLLLFNLRSLIIIFIIYAFLINLDNIKLIKLCFLASICWMSKMFFSILIPATNPLYRDIFGFKWNIYFAGDEYLTLGVFFVSIFILANKKNIFINLNIKKIINSFVLLSLILCLISQRKGSIIYFLTIFLVINFYESKKISKYIKLFILFIPMSTFLFLIFILPFLPSEYNLLFFDQLGLLNSSIDSIKHIFNTNYLSGFIGIGPFSYYEVKGLEEIYDNSMAFGSEVGNTFRFTIWSLPFGRLFLNVGLIGFFIYGFYLIKNFKSNTLDYYLISILMPLFYFENNTPINAISLGFIFIILKRSKENINSNNDYNYLKHDFI
jgi:hypothetical protein